MFLDISIRFPHLGIEFEDLGKSINVFGLDIAYYGIIIAFGMFMGYMMAHWQAKKTGQDTEMYLDFAMIAIVLSVLGARLYYVVFNWSYYLENPMQILNIRNGGLAIYGGVITAIGCAIVYSKVKKISFWLLCDTGIFGLVTGQIIGRWGNFFNREAFGDYSDGLLAMQLKKSEVAADTITDKMLQNVETINGIDYIQVHPTFLYESLWNLGLLIILLLYSRHKKKDGEIIALYFIGYGFGRFLIEGLRTDQLLLWGTNIAVSQLVSIGAMLLGIGIIIYKRFFEKNLNF